MSSPFTTRRTIVALVIGAAVLTGLVSRSLVVTPEPVATEVEAAGVHPVTLHEADNPPSTNDVPAQAREFSMQDWCAHADLQAREKLFASPEGDAEWEAEQYDEELRRVKERLADSGDAEHLHVAALLEEDPVRRVDLIRRALAIDGDNPLRVWAAVNICAAALEQTGCPLQDWTARLLELDSQNSEVWVRIAASRLANDDETGALDAIRRAGAASESRVYWPDTIEMGERAFAAASDQPFIERVGNAVGLAAANLPGSSRYRNMCKVKSRESEDWAYACLAYGEQSEREGKTLLGKQIAVSIQQEALKALGEKDRLTALRTRYSESRKRLADTVWARDPAVAMMANPTFFADYMDAIRVHGEAGARAAMQEEVNEWVRRHKDLECIP